MSNINPSNTPNNPNHLDPIAAYYLFLQKFVGVREEAGISTAELASKLDVPEAQVLSGESGLRPLDFLEVRAWLQALGVNITDFTQELDALISKKLESSKTPREEGDE